MLLDKKGAAISWPLSTVGKLIFSLVVLGVIVMLSLSILSVSGVIASDWICKTSVAISSGLFGLPGKLGFDTIFCYTEDVESGAKTKDDALEDIAEHKRACLNMWGEGKLNPEGKNIWGYRDVKCFTCHRLGFPMLEEEVSTDNIYKYLRKEWSPKRTKLKGAGSFWNYFKMGNPNNVVYIDLPSVDKDCKGKDCNVIDKNKYYAVTYIENADSSVIGHLISSSTTGYLAGTGICLVGIAASWISAGTSLLACGLIGAGGGIIGSAGIIGLQDVWSRVKGESPADGIAFRTYDAAKKDCVTVMRVESELFKENEK